MDPSSLRITKPKIQDDPDFDIFKFWKGDPNASLFLMPFFLTIDIYEMGLYRVHKDKEGKNSEISVAVRQEIVHATYHRRSFHHFHRNNIRFKYTRLWSKFLLSLMYHSGVLIYYAGTMEYMMASTVHGATIRNFESYKPHINNPIASLLMWHCLEEAEHAYCFINNTVLEKSALVRFCLMSSALFFQTITLHIFILENRGLFGWKRYASILKSHMQDKLPRSIWNFVFSPAEREKEFMIQVSMDATKVRQSSGI